MAKRPQAKHFVPSNPEKYIGSYPIVSRSSWEWDFMMYCDHHPDVVEWVSEPKNFGSGRGGIPYKDPITGNQKIYIPDFLVTILQRGGGRVTKLIEIKPMKETFSDHANSRGDAAMIARNEAKWRAARSWAGRRGIEFIIMTEAEIYSGAANKSTRKHSIKPYTSEHTTVTKKGTGKKPKTAKAKARSSSKRTSSNRSTGKVAKTGKVSRARKTRKA